MRAVFLVLTKLYGVWINRFIMAGRVVERGELPFLYLMAESHKPSHFKVLDSVPLLLPPPLSLKNLPALKNASDSLH